MSLTLTRRHNVDRFGYLIPTRYGNVPMVGAVATYRPGEGRFGGAVAVEEGTTNLANNPTFSGTVGTRPSGWHSDVTIQQDDFFGQLINVAELLCVSGNTFEDFGTSIAYPLAYNTTYTISFWARGTMELTYDLSTNRGIASATWKSKPPMSLQWQRYEVTIVTASSGDIYPFWWYLNNRDDVNVGKWVRIARIQLEQKPFATSFVDGTRAEGVLRYSASGIINPDAGTIAFWYRPEFDLSLIQDLSTSPKLIQVGNYYKNGSFTLWHYSNPGRLSLYVRGQDATGWTASGTVSPSETGFARGKWSYVAVTWDGLNWTVYVDGRRVLSVTSSQPLGRIDGDIWEFAQGSPKYSQLFGELLILPYAASEEEIRAWYEADGPIPPHPDALLQWDWQAVRPATMVAL